MSDALTELLERTPYFGMVTPLIRPIPAVEIRGGGTDIRIRLKSPADYLILRLDEEGTVDLYRSREEKNYAYSMRTEAQEIFERERALSQRCLLGREVRSPSDTLADAIRRLTPHQILTAAVRRFTSSDDYVSHSVDALARRLNARLRRRDFQLGLTEDDNHTVGYSFTTDVSFFNVDQDSLRLYGPASGIREFRRALGL